MKKSVSLFLIALCTVALFACKSSTTSENQEGTDSLSVENLINTIEEGLATDTAKTDTAEVK